MPCSWRFILCSTRIRTPKCGLGHDATSPARRSPTGPPGSGRRIRPPLQGQAGTAQPSVAGTAPTASTTRSASSTEPSPVRRRPQSAVHGPEPCHTRHRSAADAVVAMQFGDQRAGFVRRTGGASAPATVEPRSRPGPSLPGKTPRAPKPLGAVRANRRRPRPPSARPAVALQRQRIVQGAQQRARRSGPCQGQPARGHAGGDHQRVVSDAAPAASSTAGRRRQPGRGLDPSSRSAPRPARARSSRSTTWSGPGCREDLLGQAVAGRNGGCGSSPTGSARRS